MSDGHALKMERTYRAPAEAVFDAWTSEEVIRRWWQAMQDWKTSEASVDLRVGGALRVVMREPDGTEHGGGGSYTEIERPARLAFTWTWDDSDRETLIEIEFQALPEDETHVTFTHSLLADEETVRSHEYGWGNVLDRLGEMLEDAA